MEFNSFDYETIDRLVQIGETCGEKKHVRRAEAYLALEDIKNNDKLSLESYFRLEGIGVDLIPSLSEMFDCSNDESVDIVYNGFIGYNLFSVLVVRVFNWNFGVL